MFLTAAVSAVGLALAGCAARVPVEAKPALPPVPKPALEPKEAEVTPGEDLMQEHGVLERILLIYDDASSRLSNGLPFELTIVGRAASLVREFVEDYHERLEEEFLFPPIEAAHELAELVATLRQQHVRGRELTLEITRLSATASSSEPDRVRLAQAMRGFAHMYRAHAAREETVLFPAFRNILGRNGYHALGERFEAREHAQWGTHGFEDVVRRVAALEEEFGIHSLASFTAAEACCIRQP